METINQTPTPENTQKKVNDFLNTCLQEESDPVAYAKVHNINITEDKVQEAIANWYQEHEDDKDMSYRVHKLLYQVGASVTRCCEGMCSTNEALCPRKMLIAAQHDESTTYEQGLALLDESLKTKSIHDVFKSYLVTGLLNDLIQKSSSEKELNSLSKKIQEIREQFQGNSDAIGLLKNLRKCEERLKEKMGTLK